MNAPRTLDLHDLSETNCADLAVHYAGLELFHLRCNIEAAEVNIPGLRETLVTARDLINAELTRRGLAITPVAIVMPKGGAL